MGTESRRSLKGQNCMGSFFVNNQTNDKQKTNKQRKQKKEEEDETKKRVKFHESFQLLSMTM